MKDVSYSRRECVYMSVKAQETSGGKMEQAELFAPQGGAQTDETPPPTMDHLSFLPEVQEHPWLTKEMLFAEIESCDAVCPERQCDGLHLLAQEIESSDFVPKNTTEQVIRFDEDGQLVVWEAFCPDWQFPDALASYRFAADWMAHHPKDAVIVDEKSKRISWRRAFRTEWVEDYDSLCELSQLYLTDSIDAATECLNAAQLALGGF